MRDRLKQKNSKNETDKIEAAIALLNEAAVEKQHELQDAIKHHYESLNRSLDEVVNNGKHLIEEAQIKTSEAIKAGEEKVEEGIHQLDEKVHENPWPAVGFAAVGAFLIGYSLKSKMAGSPGSKAK